MERQQRTISFSIQPSVNIQLPRSGAGAQEIIEEQSYQHIAAYVAEAWYVFGCMEWRSRILQRPIDGYPNHCTQWGEMDCISLTPAICMLMSQITWHHNFIA